MHSRTKLLCKHLLYNMVSSEDVAFFKKNGYLIVRDFLSPEEIRSLQAWAQEVHDYEATETSEFMPYEVSSAM